jgi:hypothetical protein
MEPLVDLFGFQVDNGLNQAEHVALLLMNHQRYRSDSWRNLWEGCRGQAPGLELDPSESLHSRLFENYRKWAQALGVEPIFRDPGDNKVFGGDEKASPPPGHSRSVSLSAPAPGPMQRSRRASEGPRPDRTEWYEDERVMARIWDVTLLMLIWGEAANLRHMPECIAFLYHKVRSGGQRGPALQAMTGLFMMMCIAVGRLNRWPATYE